VTRPGPSRELSTYLARLQGAVAEHGIDPDLVPGALAGVLADRLGLDRAHALWPASGERGAVVDTLGPALLPPSTLPGPDLLGQVHEALLDRGLRRRRGVFYTPPLVAAGLVAMALDGLRAAGVAPVVCDPAVGGGAFLLAAGRALEAAGSSRRRIVDELLWGVDLDPRAVAVASAALALWVAESGEEPGRPSGRVAVADTLLDGAEAWSDPPADGFDLVVGNPPFLNQLGSATARTPAAAAALRRRLGPVAHGYVDAATLFVVAACRLAAPGGRVALLVPESFLATRDGRRARSWLAEHAELVGFWAAGGPVFEATDVRVCAPMLELDRDGRRRGPAEIDRRRGPKFEPVEPRRFGRPVRDEWRDGRNWSALLADRAGGPDVDLDGSVTLADLCSATAGFRDQFYGLAPHVVDDPDGQLGRDESSFPRLVTSGLIDPARSLWGQRPTRFAGRTWQAPRVDLAALGADPPLARWGAGRLVPKVVLATQTRVLEPAVDEAGTWWPSTPVIAVTASPDRLWEVAAILLAPAVSAWARARAGGAALAADAIKLSARQVLEIPLPVDSGAWAEGAEWARAAAEAARRGDPVGWRHALGEVGRAMEDAYRCPAEVARWWEGRLPPFR